MGRPFALTGFAYLLALAAAVYFGATLSLWLACATLMLAMLCFFVPRLRGVGVLPVALVAVSLAFGGFAGYTREAVAPALALGGSEAEFSGTVCELPYRQYGNNYYIVRLSTVNGGPASFKVRLSARDILVEEPYSRVSGRARFMVPEGGEGFNSRTYQASKGVLLYAALYTYEPYAVLPPENPPPYALALRLRQSLLRSVRALLPGQAGLINGVLFGEKTGLDSALKRDFSTIGVSHLLSVSGLHMATIAGLLTLLLTALRVPRRLRALAAGAGVLCFMAITCFVPSVTRSGVMCLIFLASGLVARRSDALNTLGLATLLICVENPYSGADLGLLLSVSATLGLILTAGPVRAWLDARAPKNRRLKPVFGAVNAALATTLGATLFTLPIVILTFVRVSLVAFLANVLLLLPTTLMLQTAALAALLHLLLPATLLALPFAWVSGMLAEYMRQCAHWLAALPYASQPLSGGWVRLWLAGSLLLIGVAILLGGTRRLLQCGGVLAAVLLLAGAVGQQGALQGVTRLLVPQTGGGVAVVAQKDGHAGVIGCQGFSPGAIEAALEAQGVRQLDYLQLLTTERQECLNAAQLLREYPTACVLMPDDGYVDDFLQRALPFAGEVRRYKEGDKAGAELWGINLSVAEKAVRIKVNGITMLLAPSGANTAAMPKSWRENDFLVLGAPPDEKPQLVAAYGVLQLPAEELAEVRVKECFFNAMTTENGCIIIETSPNGKLRLKGEA